MKIIWKIILFVSVFGQVFAETQFKPHMIDHMNEGCPANSHCSPEFGQKRKIWSELLTQIQNGQKLNPIQELEDLRKKNGMPLAIWAFPSSLASRDIVSWNSPCRHHNLETGEIYLGEIILQDFRSWPQDMGDSISPALIWWQKNNDEIIEFKTLQGSLPQLISNDRLYYTQSELGAYYGLTVASDGSVQIIATKTPESPPREVRCPQTLLERYQTWTQGQKIYQQPVCREVWDEYQRRYQTLLAGWTC